MSSTKSKGIKILIAINDTAIESLFIPKLEAIGYSVVKITSFQDVLRLHTTNRREIIMLTPFGLKNADFHFYVKQIKRGNPNAIIIIYKGDYFYLIEKEEREADLNSGYSKHLLNSPFDVEFVDYTIWSSIHPIQASLQFFMKNIKGYYLPKLLDKFKKRKPKKKPKTFMEKFEQIDGMKQLRDYYAVMNKNGTTEDVHPKGIGRFGYDVTNPIPTNNVFGSQAYLNRLRDKNGNHIAYERLGSTSAENIENPIDRYKITDSNGSDLGIIYISPYQQTISRKAPDGFLMS